MSNELLKVLSVCAALALPGAALADEGTPKPDAESNQYTTFAADDKKDGEDKTKDQKDKSGYDAEGSE